jgi:hypothetical protein
MKFLMAISLSIIAIIGLGEAVSSEPIDNLTKEIIETRDEATYLAFLQRDLDVLRERSIDIAPSPPKFSTFAEYEVFEKQEAQETPKNALKLVTSRRANSPNPRGIPLTNRCNQYTYLFFIHIFSDPSISDRIQDIATL